MKKYHGKNYAQADIERCNVSAAHTCNDQYVFNIPFSRAALFAIYHFTATIKGALAWVKWRNSIITI